MIANADVELVERDGRVWQLRRLPIAYLQQLVEQQAQQITELLAKLAACDDASGGTPRSPAIYYPPPSRN
jgi:hypothetical protein